MTEVTRSAHDRSLDNPWVLLKLDRGPEFVATELHLISSCPRRLTLSNPTACMSSVLLCTMTSYPTSV